MVQPTRAPWPGIVRGSEGYCNRAAPSGFLTVSLNVCPETGKALSARFTVRRLQPGNEPPYRRRRFFMVRARGRFTTIAPFAWREAYLLGRASAVLAFALFIVLCARGVLRAVRRFSHAG